MNCLLMILQEVQKVRIERRINYIESDYMKQREDNDDDNLPEKVQQKITEYSD